MATKRGCWMLGAILTAALLLLVAAVAIVALSPSVTHPVVSIHSPRNAERLAVGQDTVIQAIARDDIKIKRVELWVDDKLQDAQNTNVIGGISPFPLTMRWQPPISGTHTVVVRAFNLQGARSHATINVQAISRVDRDDDGVPDDADACPDQPGTEGRRGCPDRADEGIPDADGDGVPDTADACPREPGVTQDGCPTPGDSDGDGVADASDACPRTPGRPEYAGCPDDDGDGVPDQNDACPRERGSAPVAGCPDGDGDGVRDAMDLCPVTPGPASNSGCPVTGAGDGDNDGVRDDVDLVPDEAGPADQGGSPAPGHGADRNGNQIPDDAEPAPREVRVLGVLTLPMLNLDLSRIVPGGGQVVPKVMTNVEIQALEFRALGSGDLTDISCYVQLLYTVTDADGAHAMETVIPAGGGLNLDPGTDDREWNLPEVLGAQSERNVAADTDYPLTINLECLGIVNIHGETPQEHPLGTFIASHPSSDWDGHESWGSSPRTSEGRWFYVKYRLCNVSCGVATYRPPVLELVEPRPGIFPRAGLRWTYPGDLEEIRGFGVYVNGNIRDRMPASIDAYDITGEVDPHCGETYSFYVTAYGGVAGDGRESPPSNTVTLTSEACPRLARVWFQSLETGDLGRDESDFHGVGPIGGVFWASASNRQDLHFHISVCCDLCYCWHHDIDEGTRLSNNSTYNISGLFDSARGGGYRAPEVNHVVVDLGDGDDLTFGGEIYDVDWGNDESSYWDTLFETQTTIDTSELEPGVSTTHILSDRAIQLRVYITLLEQ